jgi:hypothetical protein
VFLVASLFYWYLFVVAYPAVFLKREAWWWLFVTSVTRGVLDYYNKELCIKWFIVSYCVNTVWMTHIQIVLQQLHCPYTTAWCLPIDRSKNLADNSQCNVDIHVCLLDGPFFLSVVYVKHQGMNIKANFVDKRITTAALRMCWCRTHYTSCSRILSTNLQGLRGGQEKQCEVGYLWSIMYPSYGNWCPYCTWHSGNMLQVLARVCHRPFYACFERSSGRSISWSLNW